MEFKSDFMTLPRTTVHEDAQFRKNDGWRYVQILAVNKDDSVDLVYSYMKDGLLQNMVVESVGRDEEVQSISDIFLEAFVCENEIHDLFGVKFLDIAIDFLGNFYRVSSEKPMTIISPAQLAEREKQKKIAAAKAAKEAKAKKEKAEAKIEAAIDAEAAKQSDVAENKEGEDK